MSILKYNDLLKYNTTNHRIRLSELRKSFDSDGEHKIFLSHRHEDKDHVQAIKALLSDFGGSVYIDSLDPDAPKTTSSETAQLIKKRINQCRKFIVLASPGSIDSKWIPWELGYADSQKSLSNIAVLPIGQYNSDWDSREYFGLYHVIYKTQNDGFAVFPPNNTSGGVTLKTWLTTHQ